MIQYQREKTNKKKNKLIFKTPSKVYSKVTEDLVQASIFFSIMIFTVQGVSIQGQRNCFQIIPDPHTSKSQLCSLYSIESRKLGVIYF